MTPTRSREIQLASRPQGCATRDNFQLVETELPAPAEGEVLVRNLFLSVDPYMRGRMNDVPSYVPPFQIGKPLEGGAVGEVVESRAEGLAPGDFVSSNLGWREAFVAPAREVRKVDPSVQPLSAYLGVLGATGFTAWVGLNLVDVKAGDRVYISAAAGAVGSVAGQLAKQRGCRVVGSAGSEAKVRFLLEHLGFDAAFNYKDFRQEGSLVKALNAAAPDGIDVYFDNVGGDHLEAALSALRRNGRIIACGAISHYDGEAPPPGPRNLAFMIGKRLTMKGFIVMDWFHQMPEFLADAGLLYAAGKLNCRETIVEGIENAPQAFLDLLQGGNMGKMIVKLV